MTLKLLDGGLPVERGAASRIRRKVEELNEAIADANDLGIKAMFATSQRVVGGDTQSVYVTLSVDL